MTAIGDALRAIVSEGRDLTEEEAYAALREIMSGAGPTPAQVGAFLTALAVKGESVNEIVGFAHVMREKVVRVEVPGVERVVDTCGTGGDGKHTFNVSTAAAFVVAACGVPVAKHGNRGMSSACGSADVLEALDARIDLEPASVAKSIDEIGIGFMFAQAFHPAMKHLAPVRRELGFRTVFNILGPLTNPAGAKHQVIGVATPKIGETIATALGRLGSTHSLVVHGREGLDEVSPCGPTTVWELKDGAVARYEVDPAGVGIDPVPLKDVVGGDAASNARAMCDVLGGRSGPLTGFVTLNAAAALVAADAVATFADGVRRADACIREGSALRKLERFVELTQELGASP